MIEIKNLSKSFGKKVVLKNINLNIPENKSLVILGPSGTGKSVLVKSMTGIMNPNVGSSVKINGHEITQMTKFEKLKLMKNFGYLFQYNALFDSLTIKENILLAMQNDNSLEEKEVRILELLKDVELESDIVNFYPNALSGGMQKRVALARALANRPKYIVLDEPITGLDPMTAAKIDYMIYKLIKQNNLTAITITHSVESTKIMGEEIIFLLDKNIHWQGSKEEFINAQDQKLLEFMYAYDIQKEKHIK